jgi:hypothetical protein
MATFTSPRYIDGDVGDMDSSKSKGISLCKR